MLALPIAADQAGPLAERYYCAVAGLNLKDQTVVGGAGKDLDRLEQAFGVDFPRKRAVRLKTEGAFHTYYMVTAAREFRADLDRTEFCVGHRPRCSVTTPVGSTTTTRRVLKPASFFSCFIRCAGWITSTPRLADGSDTVVEFGGGIGGGATPAEKRPQPGRHGQKKPNAAPKPRRRTTRRSTARRCAPLPKRWRASYF